MIIKSRLRYLIAQYEEQSGRSLSISRLARETRLAESTLRNLLNNTTQRFDGPVIAALCTYFNVPIEQLLTLDETGDVAQMSYQLPSTSDEGLQRLLSFYPDTIALMPNEFTSHEFILKLGHLRQHDYIGYLSTYLTSNRPFQVAHGRLAQGLSDYSEWVTLINDKVSSTDIFGNPGFSALWRKVK
jgi:transcriptional regulator with XRE-family HTH domain